MEVDVRIRPPLPTHVMSALSQLPSTLCRVVAGALLAAHAQAAVIGMSTPGAWPEGRITWHYNPAGRPANISDDEVLATTAAAFAAWSRVCNVEATYGGLTATALEPTPPGLYVVGWRDFGSSEFSARGQRVAANVVGGYAPLSGGSIQLNTNAGANQRLRTSIDRGGFLGTLQHEVGHTLGLSHSDDPTSIMFANPYNTDLHDLELQGDDISACADLYGGRGMIERADRRSDAPVPVPYTMLATVTLQLPTATLPSGGAAQIDPTSGAPIYFASHWRNLPAGSSVMRQWVSPFGHVYQQSAATTETVVNGFRYSSFPEGGYRFPFAGRWSFQVTVNGRMVASTPFDVVMPMVPPVASFEAAIVGERDAAGSLNWRVVSYGSGAAAVTRLVANGVVPGGTSARAQPGSNRFEVWIETDRPRYLIGQGDGQPLHSFDKLRRAAFTATADGTPTGSAIQVIESGLRSGYTAGATVTVGQTGEHGVYVAVALAGALYFRAPAGWTTAPVPLITVRGPGVAHVDLLRNLDVRGLPPGTALFVGYGRDIADLTSRSQYALVRAF